MLNKIIMGLMFCLMPLIALGHDHHAPHQGTLIVLGEEFAHLELVLDPSSGVLSAYALDGEAQNAVRLKQATINIEVFNDNAQKPIELTLKAVDNVLTGETVGDSSAFIIEDNNLKGLVSFKGSIVNITIKGQDFQHVEFDFPQGNE